MRALLLFSYPLHPPGRPERLRTEHFPRLRVPVLFVQGTADPFGTIDELRAAIALISAATRLFTDRWRRPRPAAWPFRFHAGRYRVSQNLSANDQFAVLDVAVGNLRWHTTIRARRRSLDSAPDRSDLVHGLAICTGRITPSRIEPPLCRPTNLMSATSPSQTGTTPVFAGRRVAHREVPMPLANEEPDLSWGT